MSRAVEMLLDRVMKTMETVTLPGNMLPLKLNHNKGNGSHDDTNGRVKVENGSRLNGDEDDDDDDGIATCRC